MDEDVILKKLESLSRCIERIDSKNPHSLDVLEEDMDLQDVIVLNLERAVQMCVDIGMHVLSSRKLILPDTMADTFTVLQKEGMISEPTSERMIKAVGFRNTVVHAYQSIDWMIVDKIINAHLGDFRQFAKEIYAALS